jgi:hydroxypyruvate isomerase
LPRLAANIGLLWPDRPLLARIEAAANAGFPAIEMHFPYDVAPGDVGSLARRRALTLLGINTHPGRADRGERGLGALPGREQDFAAAVAQSIDYCAASGATAIHAMAGNEDYGRGRPVFLDNLAAAATRAAAHGLTLLLEPLNPRDNPGYFYSRLDQAVSIIEELQVPNLKLQFDVYHVAIAEGDVLKKLEKYLPVIGNVQIAGVPSRAEPDEGEIAYPAVLAHLDRIGYAGWVGAEYRPRAATDAGLVWMKKLI